jgi:hypothetical protein
MEEKKQATQIIIPQTYSVLKHKIVLHNKIRTKHHPIYKLQSRNE